MPKLKELLHDECGCRLDGAIYLYVGKAVKLRNRLMGYEGGRRISRPPSWVSRFTGRPHYHILSAAVWYEDRPLIAAAEGTLIDTLKPLMNVKDRQGFGGLWQIRKPDLVVNLEEVARGLRRSEVDVWVEGWPGVYAWFVDPGDELLGHGRIEATISTLLGQQGVDQEKLTQLIRQCKVVKEAFVRRAINQTVDLR